MDLACRPRASCSFQKGDTATLDVMVELGDLVPRVLDPDRQWHVDYILGLGGVNNSMIVGHMPPVPFRRETLPLSM